MSQFDVHRARGDQRRYAPYLVVLQSDLVELMRTALIAPLRPLRSFGPVVKALHVSAEFGGETHILSPEEMAAVPREVLGERVGSLESRRHEIIAALDLLFTGI